MYEVPEFVKWVDDDLVAEAKKNVLNKYGVDGLNEKIDLEGLSIKELRELATVVAELGYDHDLYENIGYTEKHKLEVKLNKEFDRRLGEQATSVYNLLDKKFNTEKWGGEVRFHLMNLCIRKGYTEMGVLKNTVWYMHMVGKTVTVDMADDFRNIMCNKLYDKFGYERDIEGRFDESPEMFKIHNEARQKEIEAQDKFINYCLEQKFEEAFNMIEGETRR